MTTWIAFSGSSTADVHVHPEDELAPRDVLQLVDEVAVAVARRDALALEQAERMRPGRAEAAALRARDLGDVRAQLAERVLDVAGGAADVGRDLDHRLHELRVDPALVLAALDGGEHRVDVLHEVPGLGVEQHVLLLDAEGVGLSAEVVVEHARPRARGARCSLPGYRRGVDLLHRGSITGSHLNVRLRLDLDEPSRVEQLRDDRGRRRAGAAERIAVGARDLGDQLGRGDVDPRADDVVEGGAGLAQRGRDDVDAAARLLVRAVGRIGVVRA